MEYILVVDFGGQYAHLIMRRIRELNVYSEVASAYTGLGELKNLIRGSLGVILSGGPGSVWEQHHDDIVKIALEEDKHLLGICYGHQLIAKVLGGVVGKASNPEFGPTLLTIKVKDPLFATIPNFISVWMSHNDSVLEPPKGAIILASSPGSPVAAFRFGNRVYSVQWHPEVAHSMYGIELLNNWLRIVGAPRNWRPEVMVEELVHKVWEAVGESKAVAAVSGGIDSTVAALIAHKALGSRLYPVIIDHGLHPEGEPWRSLELLRKTGLEAKLIDASDRFYEALRGVRDPEGKRRVFGAVYAKVLEDYAESVGAEYLVQGTIYPDVIESGARPGASIIKTHHNVAGLPAAFKLKLVEPLKWFYKDEVRRIARKLKVPEEIIKRQPIPGPSLAVRIEGEVTREKIEIVRKADAILREEIEAAGLQDRLWQYFTILLESKATGVKGDERVYGNVIAVRAVASVDAMTASIARLPWEMLENIASRIASEVPSVVRVVYDLTSKPPATIEWE
ncbi:MAG: glutamine-hydrolyzing GMP synthase [Thermoprotei archaeon]|nr:glutamine-hydrolyzing GMP synthase [Thermoprotei archaeon]